MIKIVPNIVDYKIRLEQSKKGLTRPWREQNENVLSKDIQRCSKCKGTYTSLQDMTYEDFELCELNHISVLNITPNKIYDHTQIYIYFGLR